VASSTVAGRGSEFHSRAVSRASLSSPRKPPYRPGLSAKNEGAIFPLLWETGELKNATLASLTYIGVDAHDGVHIFRVIARLGALNRAGMIAASRPIARCSRSRGTRYRASSVPINLRELKLRIEISRATDRERNLLALLSLLVHVTFT